MFSQRSALLRLLDIGTGANRRDGIKVTIVNTCIPLKGRSWYRVCWVHYHCNWGTQWNWAVGTVIKSTCALTSRNVCCANSPSIASKFIRFHQTNLFRIQHEIIWLQNSTAFKFLQIAQCTVFLIRCCDRSLLLCWSLKLGCAVLPGTALNLMLQYFFFFLFYLPPPPPST